MDATKVGVREFRAGLAEYIAASTPVAVTRHGQTIGYFIPVHGQAETDLAALREAGRSLDLLLAEREVDAEDVVAEFKKVRRKNAVAVGGKNK